MCWTQSSDILSSSLTASNVVVLPWQLTRQLHCLMALMTHRWPLLTYLLNRPSWVRNNVTWPRYRNSRMNSGQVLTRLTPLVRSGTVPLCQDWHCVVYATLALCLVHVWCNVVLCLSWFQWLLFSFDTVISTVSLSRVSMLMHAERHIVTARLSVSPSVTRRYCV